MISIKKTPFLFAALGLAAIGITTNAQAAALTTSALWADSGKSYHACNVTNILGGAQSVTIRLLNASGATLTTSTVTLLANATTELSWGSYTGFARCLIISPYPEYIRANITVFRWDSTNLFYDSLATDAAR